MYLQTPVLSLDHGVSHGSLVPYLAAQSNHSNAQIVCFVMLWCTHLHSFGQHACAVVSNDSRISDKYKSGND